MQRVGVWVCWPGERGRASRFGEARLVSRAGSTSAPLISGDPSTPLRQPKDDEPQHGCRQIFFPSLAVSLVRLPGSSSRRVSFRVGGICVRGRDLSVFDLRVGWSSAFLGLSEFFVRVVG